MIFLCGGGECGAVNVLCGMVSAGSLACSLQVVFIACNLGAMRRANALSCMADVSRGFVTGGVWRRVAFKTSSQTQFSSFLCPWRGHPVFSSPRDPRRDTSIVAAARVAWAEAGHRRDSFRSGWRTMHGGVCRALQPRPRRCRVPWGAWHQGRGAWLARAAAVPAAPTTARRSIDACPGHRVPPSACTAHAVHPRVQSHRRGWILCCLRKTLMGRTLPRTGTCMIGARVGAGV